MSPTAQTLFDSAMALPADERVALARALSQACRPPGPPPMTGAELVACVHTEDVSEYRPDSMGEHYRPPTPGSRLGFAPGFITWIAPDFDDELPMEFWLGDDK